METDYPAAHSMDTDWFAVDKDGNVAHMSSQESGAVPTSFLEKFEEGEGYELLETISTAAGKQMQYKNDYPLSESIGLFYYQCDYPIGEDDEEALPAYTRGDLPTSPLKISDLPPALAARLSTVKLDNMSFPDTNQLQPIEFTKCETWGYTTRCVNSDGTVGDIPQKHQATVPPAASPAKWDKLSPPGNNKKSWWQKFFGG